MILKGISYEPRTTLGGIHPFDRVGGFFNEGCNPRSLYISRNLYLKDEHPDGYKREESNGEGGIRRNLVYPIRRVIISFGWFAAGICFGLIELICLNRCYSCLPLFVAF